MCRVTRVLVMCSFFHNRYIYAGYKKRKKKNETTEIYKRWLKNERRKNSKSIEKEEVKSKRFGKEKKEENPDIP